MAVKERAGLRYGRLLVTTLNTDHTTSRKAFWNCLCDCGKVFVASGQGLQSGDTRSCGCLLSENGRKTITLRNRRRAKRLVDGLFMCHECGVAKLPEEFHKSRHNPLGLAHRCAACQRMRSITAKYGLDIDAYDRLRNKFEGKCYIFGCEKLGEHIDHCHKTGHVRGWLCGTCNMAINKAVTPEILRGQADYLEQANLDSWLLDLV